MATVIIDAGHGGWDNGASYNGRTEKTDNLNLALAVGNILANQGINVLYTRTDDVYQSPNEKARIANESGADYFVSIHRNSSPNPNTYSGVQTLVYEDAGVPSVFAQNINNALERVGFTNLGTSVRKDLTVLRRTQMPAVLVEAGFINTDQDNQLFDLKFPEIAQAIADGILQSINEVEGGMQVMGEAVPTVGRGVSSTENGSLDQSAEESMDADVSGESIAEEGDEAFAIEVGRFRHYNNADGLAREMQREGYDIYIVKKDPYYCVCYGWYDSDKQAEAAEEKLFGNGFETRIVRNRVKNK